MDRVHRKEAAGNEPSRQGVAVPRDLQPLHRHFRRAVRLLSVATRFPIAAVTLADENGRQQLISQRGVERSHEGALLRGANLTADHRGVKVLPDLASSESAFGLQGGNFFFAGVELHLHDRRGVLCVMGPRRAAWDAASQSTLIEIQDWLEDTLEAMRIGGIDHLTGLANRRHIEEVLEREWRCALREPAALSLIAIDIDHFKAFNDTYGHPAGDEALIAVAAALRDALKRPGDAVGRMGGEEFMICLPHTDGAGGQLVAEAMRCAVENLRIVHAGSSRGIVTISVGCATAPSPVRLEAGVRAVVAAADRALYKAKDGGRNQVAAIELPAPIVAAPAFK